MKPTDPFPRINRRALVSTLAVLPVLPALSAPLFSISAPAQTATSGDPLPSWNDGPAKQAIVAFVKETTDQGSPKFVPPTERIAEFDQDGTLWVEHPLYTQVVFCLDRVGALAKEKPELKDREPFKAVLSGDREAIAKLSMRDLLGIVLATQSGMSVEEFRTEVKKWLATARHPRWNRPYTELVYQPMLEVLSYMGANGYKTFIATGGSGSFVREYSERVYGIPPERVAGTEQAYKYGYDKDQRPILTRSPNLSLITWKPERSRTFGWCTGSGRMRRWVIPPATTSRCWST
jgi:phosphoglycolate phosphatase-like HAD superfamily hydrolase